MTTQVVGDNTFVDERVVSKGPCKLVGLTGYNNGADKFVMVFNKTAHQANGQTPMFCCPADAQRAWSFTLPAPVDMDGVTVQYSTAASPQTLTATATADASIQGILAV